MPLFPLHVKDSAAHMTAQVYQILADGQWHTARSMGINERVVRAVAEQSQGRIIGSQRGYRLTQYATATEVARVEAWLTSQAAKMRHRAYEIRLARHGHA